MKPSTATATHVLITIVAATTLAVSYALISVYVLGNVDVKFGARGTVQLVGLIVVCCSAVAAVGSGTFHFLRSRGAAETRATRAVWSGVVVGSLLAVVHKPVLFNAPLLDGVGDWQQQCMYFVALGYVLHWLLLPVINMRGGAQQSVAADRRKDAASAER